MFSVDEATATAIRDVFNERGEISAVAEPRRHFPLISDEAQARMCVRTIAVWQPLPAPIDGKRRVPRRNDISATK